MISAIVAHAVFACMLFAAALATALCLIATPEPPIGPPRDVFDFAAHRRPFPENELPPLQRYRARDGEDLAYRLYESAARRVLIFIHGSSYHSGGYHRLAAFLSTSDIATVVTPNLRGHYQSGRRRGDVDYIGQFEDDVADLIGVLRAQKLAGPITLGGHSSGGGLVIRFAGGRHAEKVANYVPLAPILPRSASLKGGDSGGWAVLHWKRLIGLIALNVVGIRGFNGMPVVAFNKPEQFWDGTETLSYSHRLNLSYHPRDKGLADLRSLGARALVLIGEKDEAIDAQALRTLIAANSPATEMRILPGISHFGIFQEQAALETIAAWLRQQPEDAA
jgi:non-heme chloroperoxidase